MLKITTLVGLDVVARRRSLGTRIPRGPRLREPRLPIAEKDGLSRNGPKGERQRPLHSGPSVPTCLPHRTDTECSFVGVTHVLTFVPFFQGRFAALTELEEQSVRLRDILCSLVADMDSKEYIVVLPNSGSVRDPARALGTPERLPAQGSSCVRRSGRLFCGRTRSIMLIGAFL